MKKGGLSLAWAMLAIAPSAHKNIAKEPMFCSAALLHIKTLAL
jgi:hypothetical protein